MSPIGILVSGSLTFSCMFDDQLCLLPQLVTHAESFDAQLLLRPPGAHFRENMETFLKLATLMLLH